MQASLIQDRYCGNDCFRNNSSNDFAQLYFAAGIYCLHEKLAAVGNFTSVKLTEVKFAPKGLSLRLNSCDC